MYEKTNSFYCIPYSTRLHEKWKTTMYHIASSCRYLFFYEWLVCMVCSKAVTEHLFHFENYCSFKLVYGFLSCTGNGHLRNKQFTQASDYLWQLPVGNSYKKLIPGTKCSRKREVQYTLLSIVLKVINKLIAL